MSLLIKGVTKHSQLTDVSTPHALADLVAAVCSEAEAATFVSAEATARDAAIAAHAGIATVHQNAPALIATHKANASAHHTKYTDTEAVEAAEAAGLALASGKNIKVILALTANDTWSGFSAVLTAGEVLALGEAVYLKAADSEVYKALATATTTMPNIALATCATTDGNPFEFLLRGFMRHDAWNWTPGGLLYIDRTTAGALTQTAPSTTGDQVQVVGVAITADIIFFCPSLELVEIS